MATVLRLVEMIYRPKGTLARRAVHAAVAIALRLFFRRIEADGVEKVPRDEPLIFVLNHQNGMIDAGLIFVALPRRVSFLAKSTLFRLPFVSFLLRSLEVLPLFRRVDAGENVAENQKTFAACFELLNRNRCIALFPEGVSHNSPQLLPIKTGAARIALGALSVGGENLKSLKIVPVGLYYTSKTSFRSEALMRFGEPFSVFPTAPDADGQPPREAVRELSARIGDELKKVTLNVESNEALQIVRLTEQLFSSVYEGINLRFSLSDELELRRRFAENLDAPESLEIQKRLAEYDEQLKDLGVSPEHLSISQYSLWFVFRHFLLRFGLILILSPLIIGGLIHLPAYLLCLLLGRIFRSHGVDQSGGSPKILAAMMLMPATWLVTAASFFYFWKWQAALISIPVVILCGYTALRCLEELFDLGGWFRAVWVLARRRWLFVRLLIERRAIHRRLAEFLESQKNKAAARQP